MSTDLEDRFGGALVGCAVGDALGAPFEGMIRSELAGIKDITSGFRKIPGYPTGQYTDDTQLTMALAQTYAECGKFEGPDFGRKVARLWSTREIVGAGGACTHAAVNLIHGLPWDKAGAPVGQAGNGAAMRAAPTGLFRARDLETLAAESMQQSMVTHHDPRAGAGAAAVAFTVAWNMEDKSLDPGKFIPELAGFIAPLHEEFSSYIASLPEWMGMEEDETFVRVSCAGWVDPPRPIGGITPFVIPTVLACLWALLENPGDYTAGVDRVIRFGGDVDTTGAITGAMIGARVGAAGIPQDLRSGVLDSARIRELSAALFSRFSAVYN